MNTKEEAYDAEISPLMAQIIATCKRRGIACFCTFDLGDDGEGGCLMATTCLADETGVIPSEIESAASAIVQVGHLVAFTITKESR